MILVAGFLALVCILALISSIGYGIYSIAKGKVLHACLSLIVTAFFLYWSVVNMAWVSVILQWGK